MSHKRRARTEAALRRRRLRQRLEFGLRKGLWRVSRQPRYRLAACLCFKNSSTYLREWIEFHQLVGMDHFFLYNNESTDDFLPIVQPYIDRGRVTLINWPGQRQQIQMYDHCLRTLGPRAEWIAFIDDDEFVFPRDGRPLPEHLRDYSEVAGIQIPRWSFGDNGHKERPAGLVIENYSRRASELHENGKCIVRTDRVDLCLNPHAFATRSKYRMVDENHRPCGRKSIAEPTAERFRINHYECKSQEEEALKRARGKPNQERGYQATAESKRALRRRRSNETTDTEILRYAEELKAALAAGHSSRQPR